MEESLIKPADDIGLKSCDTGADGICDTEAAGTKTAVNSYDAETADDACGGKEKIPDLRTFSPLTLAYLGDAVYEVFIRTELLKKGNRSVEKFHREAIRYVKASEQARQIAFLEAVLTEEERGIYRRGCNAKPHTMPKHADPADYHHATGYEALLGWLSLKGDTERAHELMRRGLEAADGILTKNGTTA